MPSIFAAGLSMRFRENTRTCEDGKVASEKILVVEDEPDVQELIVCHLEAQGYQVDRASTGEQGLQLALEGSPDLVMLDILLPGIDGLEVFRRLRQAEATQPLPIVFLTAKNEESDVVVGLELGADDFITKPFSPRILVARIRSLLRRQKDQLGVPTGSVLQVHGVTLDKDLHQVTVDGRERSLSATEFSILETLMARPGKVFSRSEIIETVQKSPSGVTSRSVDVHIVGLRRRLGPKGRQIETIRGFGYRFRAQP